MTYVRLTYVVRISIFHIIYNRPDTYVLTASSPNYICSWNIKLFVKSFKNLFLLQRIEPIVWKILHVLLHHSWSRYYMSYDRFGFLGDWIFRFFMQRNTPICDYVSKDGRRQDTTLLEVLKVWCHFQAVFGDYWPKNQQSSLKLPNDLLFLRQNIIYSGFVYVLK